ncbi:class I SAM-dependent methyltransferase [Pedobacter sandarakinus]|uniref:class I SAM-dependent methyltransferase n=1 Tax=Pedobacter sandarakinus TaxID=353156 RepID=UPI002246EF5C|nr:class I SAM-dependent methyltransferase [Pedobacter sandarakinus]MCX2574028.1 methyltransferase domain-containing protein [Pedobacter sandarakinus]
MKQTWNEIWSKRQFLQEEGETTLESLIRMDGFDTPLGKLSEQDFRNYASHVIKTLDLTPNETVFEIGCGSGAFIYILYENGFDVSGIDFALPLIEIAKQKMPACAAKLQWCEAIDLKEINADVIIANHVFHYFPNLEYVSAVLGTILKSGGRVLITAMADITFKTESEAFRRGMLTAQEYEKKYDGLDILYFSKPWILNEVQKLAPNRKVYFLPHKMPKFSQNEYRFDCLIL